ncbi:MAG: DNA polymerase III subunit delta [Bacteroidia bacterium]|nr:MAG: DNA polymerase III subunit delta [Bacteroidia bacterium]
MAKKNETSSGYEALLKQLKKRDFRPLYLFHGDEPYFGAQATSYIMANLLREEEKAFNQFLFYGRDITGGRLVDQAQRSPMMADRSLIVVREAQEMKSIEPLADYFERPNPSTVLVLVFTREAKPGQGKKAPLRRMLDAAKAQGGLLASRRFRDYEVGPWLNQHVEGMGLSIAPDAARFVVDQMGTDLSAIANELDKLRINLPPEVTRLEMGHVADAIGVSREYNVFELTRTMGKGDYYNANRIAQNMAANPKANDITMITASIHSYFAKIFLCGVLANQLSPPELAARLKVHPFFVSEYQQATRLYPPGRCAQIFSTLRMLDMRNKGVGGAPVPLQEALKETITRIMR